MGKRKISAQAIVWLHSSHQQSALIALCFAYLEFPEKIFVTITSG
jgi:hypothetical protein